MPCLSLTPYDIIKYYVSDVKAYLMILLPLAFNARTRWLGMGCRSIHFDITTGKPESSSGQQPSPAE